MTPSEPDVSVVIPVYNEEAIVEGAVVGLVSRLDAMPWTFEVLLAENGSKDRTPEIVRDLEEKYPTVKSLSFPDPDYGKALRNGILTAEGEYVLCDEIDLCDSVFHRKALEILTANEADLVIGSKRTAGAVDRRPIGRRLATFAINGLLKVALGFRGTDTHGLKAFRRTPMIDVVNQCVVDRDLFASELVIRADRLGIRTREIPVEIHEIRPPSVPLWHRVPRVLQNLFTLFVVIRLKK
jgi:glycosyltransferase involved in cell wall biosynthesis